MNTGEIILYTTSNGATALDVRLEQETIWLTQKQIAELFGTKRPAITKHLKNIFSSGELDENSICSKMEHITLHGAMVDRTQTTEVKYYNLDAILSVGYRVNSKVTDYAYALDTLDRYDYQQLEIDKTTNTSPNGHCPY